MNKQADITLVHLQGPAPVVSAPLGCLCLLSALEAAGIRAEFRDYQLGDGPSFEHGDLVRFISDDSAGIIGISAMVNVLPHLVSALREIRMARPDKKIILGGPGPASVAASLLAEYPVADVIVRGEGEVTLPAVVHALAGGRDPAVIPGVVCRSTAGIVQRTGPGRITELDHLPLPAFHRVDFTRYNGAVPLELTRGCPFTCAFCETSAFWGREVRHYSPERVARSAFAVAERTGRTQFGFVDDTFGLDRDRAERLIDLFAGTGITWTCSTRVERLNESWVG
ncbi:MAG: B12-binding domain-containing radical SAM protein, partial [Candidatus Eisenbacteria bacterium]|nr:B12-binding domain-containing radical SAM protein [Candidatus Eisenbacteria bacterium]